MSFYTNDGTKKDFHQAKEDASKATIDSTTKITINTKTTVISPTSTTTSTKSTQTLSTTTLTSLPLTKLNWSTSPPLTTITTATTPSSTTTEDPSEKYDFLDVVKNLMYCKNYNFTLYAEGYDDLGSSEMVFTSAATENIDEMAPPSLVTVQGIEEDSIEIIWFPPEGNSLACLEKYEVIWQNLDDNNDMGSTEVDFEETSFVISMQLHN